MTKIITRKVKNPNWDSNSDSDVNRWIDIWTWDGEKVTLSANVQLDPTNTHFLLSDTEIAGHAVYTYKQGTYYYQDNNGNYILDKNTTITKNRNYYIFIEASKLDDNYYPYKSNTYYYENDDSYVLDTNETITSDRTYYIKKQVILNQENTTLKQIIENSVDNSDINDDSITLNKLHTGLLGIYIGAKAPTKEKANGVDNTYVDYPKIGLWIDVNNELTNESQSTG